MSELEPVAELPEQLPEYLTEQIPEPKSKILLLTIFSAVSVAIALSFLPLLPPSKIDFPDRIQIGNQASVKREPLIVPSSIEAIAERYLFSDFKIDLYFISSRATGDLFGLIEQVHKIKLPTADFKTKEIANKGFYATFKHGGQNYLSACINPQGGTTADAAQFLINRNRYNLNPGQFAIYAFGLADLRDKRCLWITLSTANSAVDLEKIWLQSLAYWQPRFPA